MQTRSIKPGDLVMWSQGYCEMPGLVLETKPAKKLQTPETSLAPAGLAVLAMLPELSEAEWFHERELVLVRKINS